MFVFTVMQLVAESYAQKESWLSVLIWTSDYYYRGARRELAPPKLDVDSKRIQASGLMDAITEVDDEAERNSRLSSVAAAQEASGSPQDGTAIPFSKEGLEMQGMLQIGGRVVFASIANGVFCQY